MVIVIKKILLIIYIFVPFILGIILFSFGVINIFSSLCLFLGGYILLKNILDYRMVRKNREFIISNAKSSTLDKGDVIFCKSKTRKRERIRVRKK